MGGIPSSSIFNFLSFLQCFRIFIVKMFYFVGIFFFAAIMNGTLFLISFSVCSLLVYRNITDLFTLIFILFIRPQFLVDSLVSFKYRIISPVNNYNLASSFLFLFLLFCSLVLLFWLRIQALY
jgi:hypothetical protein